MKPPTVMSRAVFWLAVSNLILAVLVVYLFTSTRAVVDDNRRQLERLCTTTTVLDGALVIPLLAETRMAMQELPPGPARTRVRRTQDNLRVAHQILAETSPCDPVQ